MVVILGQANVDFDKALCIKKFWTFLEKTMNQNRLVSNSHRSTKACPPYFPSKTSHTWQPANYQEQSAKRYWYFQCWHFTDTWTKSGSFCCHFACSRYCDGCVVYPIPIHFWWIPKVYWRNYWLDQNDAQKKENSFCGADKWGNKGMSCERCYRWFEAICMPEINNNNGALNKIDIR